MSLNVCQLPGTSPVTIQFMHSSSARPPMAQTTLLSARPVCLAHSSKLVMSHFFLTCYPAWSSPFPISSPDVSQLPKQWVAALDAAVAAGKIPKIPQSSNTPGINPVYPAGVNPNGPEVCSATYKCRTSGDIWDAPDGFFAISFDDGPTPVCSTYLE